MLRFVSLAVLGLCAACSPGKIDAESVLVTDVGDATGSIYGGTYSGERELIDCFGKCTLGAENACTIAAGEKSAELDVEQDDGLLEIEYAIGGVNADGTFRVGGLEESEGSARYLLITGNFTALGGISARYTERFVFGSGSTGIDCQVEYIIAADRFGF